MNLFMNLFISSSIKKRQDVSMTIPAASLRYKPSPAASLRAWTTAVRTSFLRRPDRVLLLTGL